MQLKGLPESSNAKHTARTAGVEQREGRKGGSASDRKGQMVQGTEGVAA